MKLRNSSIVTVVALTMVIMGPLVRADESGRARDLGIPFEGVPGP